MNKIIQKALLCLILLLSVGSKWAAHAQSISSVTPNPVCAGSSLSIAYNSATVGDTLLVWLSDDAGSFTQSDSIRHVVTAVSGTISFSVPANSPQGNGYKIKIKKSTLPFNNAGILSSAFVINALPNATITRTGPLAFCDGSNPTTLTANAGTGFAYRWFRNGSAVGASATTASFLPLVSGDYRVEVTSNNCSRLSAITTITVHANPTVSFSFTPNAAACAGTPIQFNATPIGGLAPYTYNWNFNAGATPPAGAPPASTVQNPNVAFNPVLGNSTVQYLVNLQIKDNNNCTAQIGNNIQVNQRPDFTVSSNTFQFLPAENLFRRCQIVANPIFNLILTSSSVTSGTISWGNGAQTSNFTYLGNTPAQIGQTSYTNLGQYSLSVTGTNGLGCSTTNNYVVYYGTNPSIGLANPGSTTGECTPRSYQFPLTTFSSNSPGTTYTITSNDGSSPMVFNHPPPSSFTKAFAGSSCGAVGNTQSGVNTYFVRVTATNFCNSTSATVEPITLNEPPTPRIHLQDSVVCNFSPFTVTDVSISGKVVNFQSSSYVCDTSSISYWKIHPRTGWNLIGGTTLGDSILELGGSSSLQINFTQAGIYRIFLFKSNAFGDCGWTSVDTFICVQPTPYPRFSITNNPTNGCTPVLFNLNNTSNTLSSCGKTRYKWSVESGSTLQNLVLANASDFQFVNSTTDTSINAQIRILKAGQYGFRLSITNKCGTRDTVIFVTVRDKPIVAISSLAEYCGPTQVSFNTAAHSLTVNNQFGTGPSYQWTLTGTPAGTVTGPNTANPTFSLPGSPAQVVHYRIQIRVSNDCGFDSTSQVVTIKPIPQLVLRSKTRQVCNNTFYRDTLGVSNGLTNVLYSWTVTPSASTVQGAIAQITPQPNRFIEQTITNTGTTQGYVDYIYTATLNGCVSKPDTVRVLVDPLPSPANAGPDQDYCITTSPITLTATPITVGTGTWTRVSGPGTMTITNPNQATTTVTGLAAGVHLFRWTVSSGVCPPNTDEVTIRIFAQPSQAEAGSTAYLCNQTSHTLGAQLPVVGSGKWTLVSGPSATVTFANDTLRNTTVSGLQTSLTQQYIFRWEVSSGPCAKTTDTVHVWNYPASNAGTIGGIATICSGSSTTLTVTGNTGSIVRWESSPAGLGTWTPIAHTSTTFTTPALTQSWDYRVVVQSGGICSTVVGPTFSVAVSPTSVGGTLTGATTVCTGTNSGTLTLSGQTGSVVRWEQSVSPFSTWTTVSAPTGASLAWSNLTQTTRFRAVVKSGVCPEVTSPEAIITVDPLPSPANAGPDQDYCVSSPVTLTATPITVGTGTWTRVSGPGTMTITNPNQATTTITGLAAGVHLFRWTVSSGVCPPNTDEVTIRIFAQPSQAEAGPTAYLCNQTSHTLGAQLPVVGSGKWTLVSGPSPTVTFANDTLRNTTVGGLQTSLTQQYIFRWEVSSGPCAKTTDTVHVWNYPASNPGTIGGTAAICSGSTTTLTVTGNTGSIVRWESSPAGLGTWTPIAHTSTTFTTPALTQSWDYRVVVQSGGICSTVVSPTFSVAVSPTSVGGTLTGATTVCTGTNSGTLTLSGQSGSVVRWEQSVSPFSTWTTVSAPTGASLAWSNLTQTTRFRAVVKSGVCPEVASTEVVITVDPLPSPANAGPDQVLCAQTTTALGASVPLVGTGAWTQVGNTPNVVTIAATNSASTQITGLIPGVYTFAWTVSNGVCPASVDQVQVTVLPPLSNNVVSASQVICSGTAPNGLTGTAPAGGNGSYQYQWQSSTTSATAGFTSITGATGSFHNPSTLTATTWYRRIVTSGPCADTSLPILITAQPAIANNQITGPSPVCLGFTPSVITGTIPTGGNGTTYQYQWQSTPLGGPANWTNIAGANGVNYQPTQLSASTRFRRLVTGGTCTTANISNEITIIIHPLPVVTVGTDVTLCLNTSPVTLTGTPAGGTWSGSALVNASTGLFTPSAVIPSTQVYYTYTDINGCTSKDSLFVQVIALPVVNAGTGQAYCQNAGPQTLTGFSPAGGNWTGPNVSPAGVFNPSGLAPGVYTLTYSFSGGGNNCSNSDTIQVRVNPRPAPVIAALSAQCPHASVTLGLTLATGFNTPQYTWSATNNQSLTNAIFSSTTIQQPTLQLPEWQGATAATYQLKVLVSNEFGCQDSTTASLVLNPRPNVIAQLPTLNCGPGQTQVVNTTSGNPTYAWSISPAGATLSVATSPTPTVNYQVNLSGNPIVYTLQGIATNVQGCKDTLQLTNTLFPKPNAIIGLSDTAACTPENITATNQSIPATGLSLFWQLPGSATSTQNTVSFSLANTGTAPLDFPVILQVESAQGCKDTAEASVRIYPNPKADFSAALTSGCAPFAIGGSNLNLVTYPLANSTYRWEVLNAAGVVLQVQTGTTPPSYTLTNANDTVLVRLIASNAQGCKPDTLVRTFRTIPNPVPDFTVTPAAGCSPQTFTIQNTSSVGVSSNWNFSWQYRRTSPQAGATDTVTLVNTSFLQDSTYTIKLVVTAGTGCRDSLSKSVMVFARPRANFSFQQSAYCAGGPAVAINNTSQAASGSQYRWRVSNSVAVRISDTTAQSPTFIFPDNQSGVDTSYSVVLEVRSPNGCIDSVRRSVRIQSRPVVNFSVPAGNCGPQTLALSSQVTHSSNTPANAIQYTWSSTPGGNFTAPTSANTSWSVPVNAGPSQIDYTLRLEVTDNLGCKDTLTAQKTIYPKPIANFQLTNSQGCSPFNLQIQNTSNAQNNEPASSLRYGWTWLNGSDTVAVPAIVLTNTGVVDSVYRIALRIESQHGCVDTISKPVRVFPDAKAVMATQNLTSCAPFVITTANIQTSSFPLANGTYKWLANGDSIGNTLAFPGYTLAQPNDSVLIRFIAFSSNGCKSDTASAVFRTIPNPVPDFTVTPAAGCSPQTFTIQNTSSVGVSSNWNFGWQYRRTSPQAGATDTVTLVNTSFLQDSTYTIKLVVTAGTGCRDSLSKSVMVFARPRANFSFQQSAYCAGGPAVAINNTSQAAVGSQYRWRVSNSVAVRISDTTAQSPTFIFPDNQSGADTSYLIVLEVRSPNGCIDSVRRSVRIQSRPVVNFSVPAGNCGPQTLALSSQVTHSSNTTANAIQYTWSSTPGGNFSAPTSANTSWSVPVNAGPLQIDYTLRLEVTDNLGCKDTLTAQKTIYPKPIANFQLTNSQGCSPFNLQIQNTSNAQNNEPASSLRYGWTWLNGNDTLAVPTIVLTNTGVVDSVYRIALRIESQHGCVDTISKPVRIFPDAKAQLVINSSLECAPFHITSAQLQATPYPQANAGYEWRVNGQLLGTGITFPGYTIQQPADSALIFLKVTSPNGCKSDSITAWFRTIPNPEPMFQLVDTVNCTPFQVTTLNQTPNAAQMNFVWKFGDGRPSVQAVNTQPTFTNTDSVDRTVWIRLIAIAGTGCRDSVERNVVVKPLPRPRFSFLDSSVCYPFDAELTNRTGTFPPVQTQAFRWWVQPAAGLTFSNDTSSSQTALDFPDNQSGATRTYRVWLQASSDFGCIDSVSANLLVPTRPVAQFAALPDSSCGPATITLQQQSLYGQTANWSGSSPLQFAQPTQWSTQVQAPSHRGVVDSVYSVRVRITSNEGCVDSTSRNLRIFPLPIPRFIAQPDSGCGPLQVSFTDSSIGQLPMQYQWNFGDGNNSSLQNPNHSFAASRYQDSIYTVTMQVSSARGCLDSLSSSVRVKPGPTAVLAISDTLLCTTPASPARFVLSNLSFGLVDTFYWDFGDGSPVRILTSSDTVQHEYLRDGFYWIRLKAVNACSESFDSVRIAVLEKPKPSFQLDSVGCGPLTLVPVNTTPNILTTYVWNFGNGQTSTLAQPGPITFLPNPNRTDTVYLVTLTAINVCDTVTWVDSVLVRPKPAAIFAPDTTIGCSPFRLDIFNYSLGGPNTYYWDFGNGDKDTTYSLSTFRYIYYTSRVDTFPLKMVAVNECGADSMQFNIVVFPNTVFPQLIVDGTEKFGCAPHTVRFYNASIGANIFRWRFNDGSSTLVTNRFPDTLVHTFLQAGTYTVEMEASNGCSDTSTFETIVVYPKPTARFLTSTNTLCVGDTLRMQNQSSGASLFQWSFGDGSTSLLPNPTKVYAQPGNYTIRLIVSQTSPPGVTCTDTFFQPVVIRPLPQPVINLNLSPVNCQPYPLAAQVSGANVWFANWNFGDTVSTAQDTASGLSVRYLYTQPGTFIVKVKAYSSFGCIDSASAPVQVTPSPKAAFLSSNTDSCGPFLVRFTNQSTHLGGGFLTYRWLVDGVQQANSLNFSWQFAPPIGQSNPQVYRVQLIASNGFGCSDTATQLIRVFPDAKAVFSLAQAVGCAPLTLNIQNTSIAAGPYRWFLDGQLIDTVAIPSYMISTPNDTFRLQLVALSAFGCKADTAEATIITLPRPLAAFTAQPDSGCAPLNVQFQQQSQQAIEYRWTLGNGATSTQASPSATYLAAIQRDSIYQVQLIVKNSFGCFDTTQRAVKVHPDPIASLFLQPNQGCAPLSVQFTQNGWQNATSFIRFGDGRDSLIQGNWTSFTHLYAANAPRRDTLYPVTIIATSPFGCRDTAAYQVRVFPDPEPDFTWTPQVPCEGDSVFFTNNSWGGGTFVWDFGNGQFSALPQPAHLFTTLPQRDTSFVVTLTQTTNNGCVKTITKTVNLRAKPKAAFTMSDSIGCNGTLEVRFTNRSLHANRYLWLFGDGSQPSTQLSPTHLFAQPGVYVVTLIVFSSNGCSDTAFASVSITNRARALFRTDISQGCEQITVNFSNLSLNAQSFLWSFGDGITTTDRNPSHTYDFVNSPYTVRLIAYGLYGCNDTLERPNSIVVYQPPVADFHVEAFDSIKVQPDRTFKFINRSVFPPLTYRWDFGDGSSASSEENPTHTYPDTGRYAVRLIVGNAQGCLDTMIRHVRIDTAECYLWIPTAFMPDQKQLRDEVQYFRAVGKNLQSFRITVFNKWGEVVFESDKLDDGKPIEFWNGINQRTGEECKQDVYVWRVEATFVNGDVWPGQEEEFGILKKSGTVTLIR